jgi:DNA-binding transcriptional regulator YiaG
MMCELAHGPAPSEKHQAAHNCGKGHLGCVNPAHLEWKTNLENQLDRFEHGTMPKHGKPRRILTPEQIAEVRALKGKVAQYDLAARFSVKPGTVEYWQSHDRPPRALSEDQVRAIRTSGATRPAREVAKQFGISEASARRVIRGEIYRDAARLITAGQRQEGSDVS